MNTNYPRSLTPLPISRRRTRKRARVNDCPLHPLDGWREAPNRKRVAIRNTDGAVRNVRAIYKSIWFPHNTPLIHKTFAGLCTPCRPAGLLKTERPLGA
jgi:hypothetical protein